jgi:hypothetical protein
MFYAFSQISFGATKIYNMKFLRKEIKKTYTMYLPANSPLSGTYEQVNTSINGINNLVIRNYPIRVKCDVWIQNTGGSTDNTPYFRVFRCNKNGNLISSTPLVSASGKNINQTKFFTIPANEGIKVQVYTGKYTTETWHFGIIVIPWPPYVLPITYPTYESKGFQCSYTFDYMYDEASSDQPIKPWFSSGNGIYLQGGKTYTKLDNIQLNWDSPQDNGTNYNGFLHLSGIKDYQVYIDGVPKSDWLEGNTINMLLNTLAQNKEYKIAIKARDFENNESVLGEETILIIDKTAPTVPGKPMVNGSINGFISATNITWTWDSSMDLGSGIKGYKVYVNNITNGPIIANGEFCLSNSYNHDVVDGSMYTCKVVAVDNLGFESNESPSTCIIIDNSVQGVVLPDYPVHLVKKT